jgi:hypothetical protein
MFTTAPPPALSTIFGTQRWVNRNAWVTLKRKAASKKRSLVWSAGRGGVPPALLTSTSRRPSSSRLRSASASRSSVRITSQGIATARRPSARICAAVSSICPCVRAAQTTSAPASAKARAIPRPIPRPAPVTSATRPSRRKRSRIMRSSRGAYANPGRRSGITDPSSLLWNRAGTVISGMGRVNHEGGSQSSWNRSQRIDPGRPGRASTGSGPGTRAPASCPDTPSSARSCRPAG